MLSRRSSVWIPLAAIYTLAGKLGLALAFVNASATAVWPPTGIALAAVLVFGPRVWPGIFLGAFLTNETTAGSVVTSLLIASGNTLEALIRGLSHNLHPSVLRLVVGGALQIITRPGQGTTIRVRIPAGAGAGAEKRHVREAVGLLAAHAPQRSKEPL